METRVNESVSKADDISGDPLITPDMLKHFTLVSYCILTGPVCFFGIIFNVINLVTFVKMGLKDPVNITLASLAVADGCSLVPLLWISICYNPLFVRAFPNLDFNGIQHVTAGWPHICLTRITGWLTALITFERYLCVAFPLKVKSIVTPERTIVAVLASFAIMIASFIPVYLGIGLGSYFQPPTNQTIISLAYRPNGHTLENGTVSFITFAQLTSFALVVICTAGLVQKIQSKAKWRSETSSASKNESTSTRDKTVVKMVICISAIFITTYTPIVIAQVCMLCFKEYSITGRYNRMFQVTGTIIFCLEAINSTINIFVYLKMSSKYRETLKNMLGCHKEKK